MTARIDAFVCDGLSLTVAQGRLGITPGVFSHVEDLDGSTDSSLSEEPLQISLQGSLISEADEAHSSGEQPVAFEKNSSKQFGFQLHTTEPFSLDFVPGPREAGSGEAGLTASVSTGSAAKDLPSARPVAPVRLLRSFPVRCSASACDLAAASLQLLEGDQSAHPSSTSTSSCTAAQCTPHTNAATQTAIALPCSGTHGSPTGGTWANYVAATSRAHMPPQQHREGNAHLLLRLPLLSSSSASPEDFGRLQASLCALHAEAASLLQDVRRRRKQQSAVPH